MRGRKKKFDIKGLINYFFIGTELLTGLISLCAGILNGVIPDGNHAITEEEIRIFSIFLKASVLTSAIIPAVTLSSDFVNSRINGNKGLKKHAKTLSEQELEIDVLNLKAVEIISIEEEKKFTTSEPGPQIVNNINTNIFFIPLESNKRIVIAKEQLSRMQSGETFSTLENGTKLLHQNQIEQLIIDYPEIANKVKKMSIPNY